MKGLVIINGYPNGEKFLRQGERIAEELRGYNVHVDVIKNGDIGVLLEGDGTVKSTLKEKYSFAVYLDKDKYLGRMLEMAGLRLFNCAEAIETCDDKMLTYLALRAAGVSMAKTIPAPLCYTPNTIPKLSFLQRVAKELQFPLVAKKSYGSFGAGVRLIHDMNGLQETEGEWLYIPHFYQEYVKESAGCDVRVIVIGGKAIASMERLAQEGEFRSNVELGGQGRRIVLDETYRQTAERVAEILGLDYCGVDLLKGERGPIVCEVNSNAFFEGLESVTGINVAKAYAEYILETFNRKSL